MNEIEKVLHYITEADRIEAECAAETSRVLREAVAELDALLVRIEAGEFEC